MQQSQRTQNVPGRKIVREVRQYEEEQQIPIESRTHNVTTTSVYINQNRVINPRRVEANRTTNYTLARDLNRQAAVNTAVKNQIQGQAPTRQYGYDSNITQSQNRSSREGRVYHYEPTTRKEFIGRNVTKRDQRGRIISSVDTTQKGNVQYKQIGNENYQSKIYVSDSGSPGSRRYSKNIDEYQTNNRGGIVKLRKWKYTTQTEINKIIMIQRWWRYALLIRKEQRQSRMSDSSEQRSENVVGYEENERYGRSGFGEEAHIRTETRLKRNAREKIIAGTKNRYIVETTTIEVFKNQNTLLKKVQPEELTKETKKIKRKTIKEQMVDIWNRENVKYDTERLAILSEGEIGKTTTEIIEEYEVQMKQFKSLISKKDEEIIELERRLKDYETSIKVFNQLDSEAFELELLGTKSNWDKLLKERKEGKINIKGKEKVFTEIEILEMFYKIRKPFEIDYGDELKILVPKEGLRKPKPKNLIEQKDRFKLLSKEKAPLIIEIEERDSLIIPSLEKDPLQAEYINELFITGNEKEENQIQIIDQMEIFRSPKPDNEIEYLDEVEYLHTHIEKKWTTIPSNGDELFIQGNQKPENKVEERDSISISSLEKEPLQSEYVDELFIEKVDKPENEIQIIDQMEILRTEKTQNEIECVETFELLYSQHQWITKPSDNYSISILGKIKPKNIIETTNEFELLGKEKPENKIEERDSLIISGIEKEELQTEYIDEILLKEDEKPENEIQIVDQMEILKGEKPKNEVEYVETIELLSSKIWTIQPSKTYEMTILKVEKPKNEKIEYTNDIQLLGKEKPENEVEERDSVIISGIEKEELQIEYINEILIEKDSKPENEIQIIDQMEILRTEKPENEVECVDTFELISSKQWSTQPSKTYEMTILRTKKPENEIEERDSLIISGKEKEELQTEYIDEILLKENEKPENEIQIVDQMEILKSEKPDNEIEFIEEININGIEKEPLKCDTNEEFTIYGIPFEWKNLITENTSLTLLSQPKLITNKIVYVDDFVLLSKEKPENIVEERDSLIISGIEKEPLQTEYIDEIILEEINKPENEIQIIDQMEILKTEKPENEIEYVDTFELLSSKKWTTKPSKTYERKRKTK